METIEEHSSIQTDGQCYRPRRRIPNIRGMGREEALAVMLNAKQFSVGNSGAQRSNGLRRFQSPSPQNEIEV